MTIIITKDAIEPNGLKVQISTMARMDIVLHECQTLRGSCYVVKGL